MIKFKDLPDTDTPITAENLNNNFEEASVAISPTEPTTNEKVWFKKGKNLLPVSAYTSASNGLTFTVNENGSVRISGTSTARTIFNINYTRPIKLQEGNYVLSKTGDASYVEVYLRKTSSSEMITSMGGTGTVKKFTNTYMEDIFAYIAIASGVTINTTITLQLEAGTEATAYEPYIDKEIYVKNANDVFEEFINAETMGIETMTNDNGRSTKFPDGTMICTLDITVTDQAIDTELGSLYRGTRVWEYPFPFISTPVVTCGQFKWGTGSSWGSVTGVNYLRTTLIGYDCYSRATGTSCNIQATAIGRWK